MPRGLLVLKCLLHLVTRMWGWCLESGTLFSCRTCNKLWTKYEGKKIVSLNVGIKVFTWENSLSECQSYPSAKTIVAPSQEGNKWLPIFEMCRSVRKNINVYEIKTSYHENCLSDFFFTSCNASLTCSLRKLVRFPYASQLANKNRTSASSIE